jgi:uncharacterized protein (TIGR02246 family)
MRADRPEDCDRLFAEGVNAGDVEAVVTLYEENGCFVQRESAAVGHAAIRPVIERMLTVKSRLSCRVRRVVRSGEDLALLYNDWSLTVPGPDGQPVERTGRALELVRRQPDGSWRFVIDDPYGRG